MSFQIYEENDALLNAINGVIAKDAPTDTRWMSESELVERYEKTKAANIVATPEVKYGTVFNHLVKEISEATDTKLKTSLETLCFVLMQEHTESDIADTAVLERIAKILNRELIKESTSVELLKEASAMTVSFDVSKKLGTYGDEIAEAVFDKLDEGDFDFADFGGQDSFTTEDFGWNAKKQLFTLSASTEPVDVKTLAAAADEIIDFIEEEFGLNPEIFGKPKFK